MPKTCCIVGCSSRKHKGSEIKFFVIPNEKFRREKWLSAINRARINSDGSVDRSKLWSPRGSSSYVCSLHFLTGLRVNDPTHPDYVPNVFPTTSARVIQNAEMKVDRYERIVNRSQTNVHDPPAKKRLMMRDPTNCTIMPETADSPSLVESSDDVTGHPNCVEDLSTCENLANCRDETRSKAPETPEEARGFSKSLEESEREMFLLEISNLREERDNALAKVAVLESMMNGSSTLSSVSVEGNDEACKMLTGLSWNYFLKLFLFLSHCFPSEGVKCSIPLREQLFLTLVKLKHNVSFDFLSHLRGLPKSTMIDNFWKWIDLMHQKLDFLVQPQDRESVLATIPPVFKSKFPRLTSIIDCFEIFIDAPRNLLARAQCYSQYKKHCTIKFFISCTPLGAINFISRAWGGRATDKKIVRDSGFISSDIHLPGDQILADRGFTLKDDFASRCGAELLTPAFTKGKGGQLPAKELEISRKIASVRIHIERVIGLLKNRYCILKGPLPLRFLQSIRDENMDMNLANCDKIIQVCCCLLNMGDGIVYKEGSKEE
ncbi:uncharacterized protein LOC106172655 [Lingula anatina]|uniref:Uncharacterized protein LOC106172655 n=1 Tax=Lingula anatina TaxID=7574 RepID=A0A1S3JER1_LINAN|nr:uncharacterized protein LOC106172655 [Lingula anatina]|eukprot:XP_013408902.1 uncharacterized protein LOC106172655 [Lingula anatina]